jgi:GPH family glycoside/pentoside/hexuronide:cation symporter
MFLKTQISWTILFVFVGLITFIACLLQYYFTRERVTEETIDIKQKNDKVSVAEQVKSVTSDKFWWIIIIFYLIFQFSGAIKNLSMVYYCENVIDNSFWQMGEEGSGMTQSLLSILGAIPMAIASVIVWPLSNKFGKKNITIIGMIVGVIGGIIALIGGNNVIMVAIGVALKCLGSAPACYLILAMISDVIDHLEIKNGFRSDGFTMSIYSSIMTGATGIGTALFNAILGLTKYERPTTLDDGTIIRATQNAATKFAIEFSYLWVETIGFAICIFILIFFTVEKTLKEKQTKS